MNAQDETVTVEVTGLPEGVQNAAFEVTITFSEAVSGFEMSDIAFSDDSAAASVTDLTLDENDDTVYTAEITPADGADGDVIFQVPEDVVKPADADEDAEDDNAASSSQTVKVDLVPPEVSSIEGADNPQNSPFDLTITFSEPVRDFQQSELHIVFEDDSSASSTITSFSPKDATEDYNTEYTVSISPPADTKDMLSVSVPADVAQDLASNKNKVSASHNVHIDTIKPTVTITVPAMEQKGAFDLTITFSEDVTGFGTSGVMVTGEARATAVSGSGKDYEVTITPNGNKESDVTLQVKANAAQDLAGNNNTASSVTSPVHIDTIVPTVESIGGPSPGEKNGPFDVTVTFTEDVTGFGTSGVMVTGEARATAVSGSGADYRVTITPNGNKESDVTLRVKANAAQDLAGNNNTASSVTSPVHIDTIVPTVESIGGPSPGEKNGPFDVTVTFTEDVTGFGTSGIMVTGEATATAVSGSGKDYEVTITPNANKESDVTLQVKANAVQDLAGNNNTASSVTSPVHIDTIVPTVMVTDVPDIEKNVPFDLTVTFSEPVNGFAVPGGLTLRLVTEPGVTSVSPIAAVTLKSGVDGEAVYVVTITPNTAGAEGDVTVTVNATTVQDFALNDNATPSGSHTIHVDTIAPTVSVSGFPTIDKNVSYDLTVTFSEPVNGFSVTDDLRVTLTPEPDVTSATPIAAATLASGEDGDSVYTVTITPNAAGAEGDVTVTVNATTVQDFALNANPLGSPETDVVHIDTIVPTVEINVPPTPQNGAFDITITFSEPVTDFQQSELYIVFGDDSSASSTITSFSPKNATEDYNTEYTVSISPPADTEDMLSVSVPADVAQDVATNKNSVSDTKTVTIDRIRPKVLPIDVPPDPQNGAFDITITFSEPVTDFQQSELYIVFGDDSSASSTITSFSPKNATEDYNTEYTVSISPPADTEDMLSVSVPADVAQDAATNKNSVSDTKTVTIDRIRPTVAITRVPDIEKNESFDLTITFSEPVNGFQASDLGNLVYATRVLKSGSAGDSEYVVTITPNTDAEGDVIIQVPVGAAKDNALNNNTASQAHTVHIDTIVPTVEIIGVPSIEKNVAFDLTIKFSEAVNGFAVSDLTVDGEATAILASGSNGASEYVVTITPNDEAEGDVTILVPAGAVTDAALNENTASNQPEIHIDTILPTVEIINVPQDVQLEAFSVTIVFSEDMREFVLADITRSGDAVVATSELTGSGSEYTLTITPHEDTDGDVMIQVLANVAEDEATNPNTASLQETVTVAPLWIPDPNLRVAVRQSLGLADGEDFSRQTMLDLALLDADGLQINDLTGLEYATDLSAAELNENEIIDISFLKDLTQLTTLDLSGNRISNISSLENLTQLITLTLENNDIGTILPLAGLTGITMLNLRDNNITDISSLADFAGLTHLDLTNNQIRDVSPILGLKNLEVLRISGNPILDLAQLVGLAAVVELDEFVPGLIPDPRLTGAIRKTLGLDDATDVTIAALQGLTTLEAPPSSIRTLDGLAHATALTTLKVGSNAISDLTPLAGLTNLTILELNDNFITDLTPLAGLTNLTALDLSNNSISDLKPLVGLKQLTTLKLNGNAISDLSSLGSLTHLTTLELADNAITDLTPLAVLQSLTTLNLSGNSISDLTPLDGLEVLTLLDLSGNVINDLNVVAGLTGVTTLNLSGNSISDLTPLADLKRLIVLKLSDNSISNLSPLADLTNLTTLELNANNITDITELSRLTKLSRLALSSNSINNLTPLTSLTRLRILNLSGNSISSLNSLTVLTQLTTLDLMSNDITDVAPLAGLVNLLTLRLAENPILNTTPLYPLTLRVLPVDIDIAVSRFLPWDVNADGSVNAVDSALVTAAFGQSGDNIVNPRTDVNGDGTVNNADLSLISAYLNDAAAGAPAITDILTLLSPDETRLLANYPNPFNPETWIPYHLARGSDVQIAHL